MIESRLEATRAADPAPDCVRIGGKPEVIPPIFRKILAAAVGRTGRSVPVLFQFANPNIAVADRVVVVLQSEASAVTKGTHLSSATRLHSDRRDTELNL